MKIGHALTAVSLAFVASAGSAQTVSNGNCRGFQVLGDVEVPLLIQARTRTLSSARQVADYDVQLGDDDRMSTLCLHGGGDVVLVLPEGGRYRFRGIEFEYPYGFEPAVSPFKLAVIQPASLRFHMRPGTASDGLPFKYTLTVEDVKTGALLLIDPMVVNERVG